MIRFSAIDGSNRWGHTRLQPNDECFYLYEYTAGRTFTAARTNTLIRNLKKKPSDAHKPGYVFKAKAIAQCADALAQALDPTIAGNATFVPIPGSKAQGHADHDNRIEQICRKTGLRLDIRPLITQRYTTPAAHESRRGDRVTVEKLTRLYQIDENQSEPTPTLIAVVDDVLTSGTHYRAISAKLQERWPDIPIIGLFIARRVFPATRDSSSSLAGVRLHQPQRPYRVD